MLAAIILAAGLGAAPAGEEGEGKGADQGADRIEFEQSFAVEDGQVLRLELEAGASVDITGVQGTEVHIVARRGKGDDGSAQVRSQESEQGVLVKSWFEESAARERERRSSLSLQIQVPPGLAVEVESQGGHIAVQNVHGGIEGRTAGGHLQVKNCGGTVNLSTGGGHIQIEDSQVEATVNTGGGHIQVTGVRGSIAGRTGGGSIEVRRCELAGRLSTNAGNVVLEDVQGDLHATTGAGRVRKSGTGTPAAPPLPAGGRRRSL